MGFQQEDKLKGLLVIVPGVHILVVLETNTVLNGLWNLPKTKKQVTGGFVLSINLNLNSAMKNLLKTHNPFRLILLTAIMFIASSSSGQKIKPSNSGYAPVNSIK